VPRKEPDGVLQVLLRTHRLLGASAILIDDQGEQYLEAQWDSAACAMLEAAMAFGASAFVTNDDRPILLAAWRAVFGRDPVEVECVTDRQE
jgi:hypothetical protein